MARKLLDVDDFTFQGLEELASHLPDVNLQKQSNINQSKYKNVQGIWPDSGRMGDSLESLAT